MFPGLITTEEIEKCRKLSNENNTTHPFNIGLNVFAFHSKPVINLYFPNLKLKDLEMQNK